MIGNVMLLIDQLVNGTPKIFPLSTVLFQFSNIARRPSWEPDLFLKP